MALFKLFFGLCCVILPDGFMVARPFQAVSDGLLMYSIYLLVMFTTLSVRRVREMLVFNVKYFFSRIPGSSNFLVLG